MVRERKEHEREQMTEKWFESQHPEQIYVWVHRKRVEIESRNESE